MPPPLKADELLSDWSRGKWKPVYLFSGTEDFLIEQALHQVSDHWLAGDAGTLNKERLDAESDSAEDIVQAMRTLPFPGSVRVVQVDNTAQLSASDQKRLAEEMDRLAPETRMVFVWGREWRRDDASKPLVEAIAARGDLVIFWPLFPDAAQRWVLQRVGRHKKTLSSEGAGWLVQHAGESLRGLDQELAKACMYVGERPNVELQDLQASFGYQKASSPYDWINFVRQKRSPAALQILERLLREGEEPIRLLALLSKSVKDWLSASKSQEPVGVLGMRFHIKRGEENRFAQELSRWTEEELERSLELCVEMEHALKTGKESPDMGLTLLTLNLGRIESLYALS